MLASKHTENHVYIYYAIIQNAREIQSVVP